MYLSSVTNTAIKKQPRTQRSRTQRRTHSHRLLQVTNTPNTRSRFFVFPNAAFLNLPEHSFPNTVLCETVIKGVSRTQFYAERCPNTVFPNTAFPNTPNTRTRVLNASKDPMVFLSLSTCYEKVWLV